jgi:hypothetical protein
MSLDDFADFIDEDFADLPEQDGKPKRPPMPGLPLLSRVTGYTFQFFDNGEKPGKGRSQHTIKLELFHREWGIDLTKPDRYRTTQMLTPKRLIRWAEDAVEEGSLDEEQLGMYQTIVAATKPLEGPDVEWVKIGVIEDARANVRYHGQFMVASYIPSAPLHKLKVSLYKVDVADPDHDGRVDVNLKVPKSKPGKFRKERAAKLVGYVDPRGILKRQLQEEQARRAGIPLKDFLRQSQSKTGW